MEKKRRVTFLPLGDELNPLPLVTWPPFHNDAPHDLHAILHEARRLITVRRQGFQSVLQRHETQPLGASSLLVGNKSRLTDSLRRLVMDCLDLRDGFRLGQCCIDLRRIILYVRPSRPICIHRLLAPPDAQKHLATTLASLSPLAQHVEELVLAFDGNPRCISPLDYLQLVGVSFPTLRHVTVRLPSRWPSSHKFDALSFDHGALAKTLSAHFPRLVSFALDGYSNHSSMPRAYCQHMKGFAPFPESLTRLSLNAAYPPEVLPLLRDPSTALCKMVKGLKSWSLALDDNDFAVPLEDDDNDEETTEQLVCRNRRSLVKIWRHHQHLEELEIQAPLGRFEDVLCGIVWHLPNLRTLRVRRDVAFVDDIPNQDRSARQDENTSFSELKEAETAVLSDKRLQVPPGALSALTCLDLSGCGEMADSASIIELLSSRIARKLTSFSARLPFKFKAEDVTQVLGCLHRHGDASSLVLQHLELVSRKTAIEYAGLWNPHPSRHDPFVKLVDLEQISRHCPKLCNATATLMPLFVVDLGLNDSAKDIQGFFANKCWSSCLASDRSRSTLKLQCPALLFGRHKIAERILLSEPARPLPRFIHLRLTNGVSQDHGMTHDILKTIAKRRGLPAETRLHLYAERFDHRFWRDLGRTVIGKPGQLQWGGGSELHVHCLRDQTQTFVTDEDKKMGYNHIKHSVKTLLTPRGLFASLHRAFRTANPDLALSKTSEDHDGHSHSLSDVDDSKGSESESSQEDGTEETKAAAPAAPAAPAAAIVRRPWSHVSKLVLCGELQLEWTFLDVLEVMGAISCLDGNFEFETRVSAETARRWSWFALESAGTRHLGLKRVSRRPEFARCFQVDKIFRHAEYAPGNTYVSLTKHKKHPLRLLGEVDNDSDGSDDEDFDDQDIFPIDTVYELSIVHVATTPLE